MPRFYVNALEDPTVITGEDARHIVKSLRMNAGELLVLCDGNQREAEGVIVSLSADAVTVRLSDCRLSQAEPACQVALFVCYPKSDKAEWIIQKAVEIGAAEIVFVLSERCIARPDKADFAKKLVRYNKIALEAAKQSGRGSIPKIRGLLEYSEGLKEMAAFQTAVLFFEGQGEPLTDLLQDRYSNVALMSGCEGGFSLREIDRAKAAGIRIVSLGKRIFRCETAPLVGLTAVLFSQGDLGG